MSNTNDFDKPFPLHDYFAKWVDGVPEMSSGGSSNRIFSELEKDEIQQELVDGIAKLNGRVKSSEPVGSMPDPKGPAGKARLPLMAIPQAVLMELSVALGEGMLKYGRHNWRYSRGVEVMTYIDAARRHLAKYEMGQEGDPDCGGVHEITKAIASLVVIRDAIMHGKEIDNRPPPVDLGLIDKFMEQWNNVRKQHESD